jgi:MFS family permease
VTKVHEQTMSSAVPAYWAFAAFGALWGVWGAALPQIRAQADVGAGQLGTALLFVGAGALPAMLLTGRAIDRWGRRVPAVALVALAAVAVLLAVFARGALSLSLLLLLLGAASGAADVAINAVAGAAERACERPVITFSHAVFSTAVVASSLLTGLLQRGAAPLWVAFGVVVAVAATAAWLLLRGEVTATAAARDVRDPAAGLVLPRRLPFLLVGVVAALAFVVENAHQSWGAIYLVDVMGVSPAMAAVAPALFAAVAAVTRFAAGTLSRVHPAVVLLTGGAAATAGTVVVATSRGVPLALLGLAGAAAGTAVLFPTLLSASTNGIDEAVRGRATSLVSTTAYLGFLCGPVVVGQLADNHGLREALIGVAVIAALFTALAWPAVARSEQHDLGGGRDRRAARS